MMPPMTPQDWSMWIGRGGDLFTLATMSAAGAMAEIQYDVFAGDAIGPTAVAAFCGGAALGAKLLIADPFQDWWQSRGTRKEQADREATIRRFITDNLNLADVRIGHLADLGFVASPAYLGTQAELRQDLELASSYADLQVLLGKSRKLLESVERGQSHAESGASDKANNNSEDDIREVG